MNLTESPNNTHNKRSLIRTSHVCNRRREAGRNQQVEEYKQTHTHTHTPAAAALKICQIPLEKIQRVFASKIWYGNLFVPLSGNLRLKK